MKWYVQYGIDDNIDWNAHKTTVRDIYLWAKKEGHIKRFPRKLKKYAYFGKSYHNKYHSKVYIFVSKYYYMYLNSESYTKWLLIQ